MLKSAISCSTEQPTSAAMGYSGWSDWCGMVASVGCAIHCAATPLVIAFLPALGLSFLADESFHQVMVGVCSVLAIAAFVPGWRRHRRLLPMGIAGVGLSLIAVAAFALEGSCCQACAAASPAHERSTASTDDACCEFCIKEPGSTDLDSGEVTMVKGTSSTTFNSSTDEPQSSLARFFPWVTPLGGVFLIAAHLFNRRGVNRCCGA